jgi:GNAT superfamily N-acetyltransferase
MTGRTRVAPARDTWSDLASSSRQVSALVARSWAENADGSIDYTAPFLDWCFACPGMSRSLAPSLYRDGALSAFAAAFPRRVIVDGRELAVGLVTLFTVAPECKRQGIGTALWAECLVRLREQGFDGAVHWCVEGNPSNAVTAEGAVLAGASMRLVVRAPWWMRFVSAAALEPAPLDARVLPDVVLESSAGIGGDLAVRRVWSREEAAWYCRRPDLVAAYYPAEAPRGCVLGYVAAAGTRDSVVVIEETLWHRLAAEERMHLLDDFLARASVHARTVVVPDAGHAGVEPFAAARFRRSPRTVNGYLTTWSDNGVRPGASGVYLDVF